LPQYLSSLPEKLFLENSTLFIVFLVKPSSQFVKRLQRSFKTLNSSLFIVFLVKRGLQFVGMKSAVGWPVENRHVIQLISDPAFVPIVGIR